MGAVVTRAHRAVQNVILVGGDHQLFNRQPHLAGDGPGKDIAEIARGHGETHGAPRRAQGDGGVEVIDHLRQNPRPVDAVHTRQPHLVAEGEIVEHVLHAGLTIVKVTRHGNGMDIGLDRRRHLAALHLGHAAMRIQDEHIHIGQPAERLDGCRSGIAAGGAHDGHPLARPRQCRLKQLADQLHGKVLEGQRGPVEQFQQEVVAVQLHQRRTRGMAEPGIGGGDQAAEFVIGEGAAQEGAHHAKGGFLIAEARQRRDLGLRHHRHGLGHVKPAIARKPRHHRLVKAQNRCSAPGRDVVHIRPRLSPSDA